MNISVATAMALNHCDFINLEFVCVFEWVMYAMRIVFKLFTFFFAAYVHLKANFNF